MRTLLKIVIPVLLAIGIFITIEVSLRFFDYGFSASYVIQKQTSGGSRAILNPSALLAYTGLSVVNFSKEAFLNISVNKSENDIRVLFLGGSAAYGPFHAPDLGIARYLEAMLELQFPDNNINVINLAFPSLNSSAVKRILQDALMLRPDFVVYYGAANELGRAAVMQKSALSPDAVFFLQEMVYAVKRLKTYQLAVTIAGKYMRDTAEFFIKDHYKDFQSFQHLRPQVQKALGESFRYNLKEIKALCRENDIPIFLCTYAHNMKNLCTADPFSEQTGPHDIKPQLALLQQAYGLEKAGDYEGAIKLYKQSRRALPRFAAPLCHMAFCYYALDRPRQAAGAYKKARSRSVGYSAQLKNFNQVLRNMAAASSEDDVFLIDIVSALKKASPLGYMTDETFFTDNVHLTPKGSYEAAANIYRSLAARIGVRDSLSSPSQTQCERKMGMSFRRKKAFMVANSAVTFFRMFSVLGRPPMSYALMHDVTKKQRLKSFNEETRNGPHPSARISGSLFFVKENNPDFYFYKTKVLDLTKKGKNAAAVTMAEALVEKTDRHSLALILYGQTLIRDHQLKSALNIFKEALDQDPRAFDLGLRLSAAEVALHLNRTKEALELLEPGWRIIENRHPIVDFDKKFFAGFKGRYRQTLKRAQRGMP